MPYQQFNNGDVLEAADLNNLMRQSSIIAATRAERDAIPFPVPGMKCHVVADEFDYTYRAGGWYFTPGQILAHTVGPALGVGGSAGLLVGDVIETPPLLTGQRVKIVSSFSQYSNVAGVSDVRTKWRNHEEGVTNDTFDGSVTSRAVGTSNAQVTSGRGFDGLAAATIPAKISAGIFIGSAASFVYGQDGTYLRIESA